MLSVTLVFFVARPKLAKKITQLDFATLFHVCSVYTVRRLSSRIYYYNNYYRLLCEVQTEQRSSKLWGTNKQHVAAMSI
jgi:hypothetical protein